MNLSDLKRIIDQKTYKICVLITAVLSYGFAVCQPMVGVDDSAIGRYFADGIGPIMGRFGYYLLHKICPVAEYTPFITDFIGVLCLVLGSALWCLVWEKAMQKTLSEKAATIFSCVMISCPMISEVFIYYLHNGIGMCYCLSALFMLFFMEALEQKGKARIGRLGISLVLLWLSNSFMESFTIVFLMAVVMMWVLQTVYAGKKLDVKTVVTQGLLAGVLLALSIALRSVTIEVITAVCSLQDQIGIMNRRSILEALKWFQSSEGLAEFVMTIKQYIVMYYVNAIAYIPVRIYLLAVILYFVWSLYRLVRHRQIVPLLGAAAMQIVPLILVFLEGHATFYRNSQFVPIYVAFVAMLFTCIVESCKHRYVIGAWCVAIGILVYNQAYEMTQWFYVDYMKYEDAVNTVNLISYELEKEYDTQKPVVFKGNYTIPKEIISKMCVEYDSEAYKKISVFLNMLDPNLKDCFVIQDCYSVSSEAIYSVFTWGNIAFEGWDKETHDFFAMHGHLFERIEDAQACREIQSQYEDMPAWPKEGSIIDAGAYIVVNFG